MITQQVKPTTTTIHPKIYAKYYNISQNFHKADVKLKWFDFNLFMYDVADAAIEEALNQPKKYGPDGRFYNLLRFRYTDFLRKHQPGGITSIQENNDAVELKNSTLPKLQICFDKATNLIDELLLQVDGFTEGQIATTFIDIAKQFNITHFIGIKLEEVEAIFKILNKTRQNRSDHRKKFKALIANITTKTYSRTELQQTKDYKGIKKEAIIYFEKGLQYRYEAKNLKINSCLKADIRAFFKCFLCYLKASFCFKKAAETETNFHINRYNYAYVLKRLGFFAEAIVELKELLLADLPSTKKSMVLECIGDTFLMNGEIDKAINYFESALKLNPNDTEILFNLLDAYYNAENNSDEKITEILNTLVAFKQPINNPCHLLLINQLNESINPIIIQLTSLIKKLK